jgi:hypothetical protein
MANNKAEKMNMRFPLNLNLADDRPHIDTTFNEAKKINGPFLNGMIQPLYVNKSTKLTDEKNTVQGF